MMIADLIRYSWPVLTGVSLIVLLALSTYFLYRRKYRASLILLLGLIALNAYTSFCAFSFSSLAGEERGKLRLMSLNMHSSGCERPEDLVLSVKEVEPDVLVLIEYDTLKCQNLKRELSEKYHYQEVQEGCDWECTNAGFSKYPILSYERMYLDTMQVSRNEITKIHELNPQFFVCTERVVMKNEISVNGRKLNLYSCHLMSTGFDAVRDTVKTTSTLAKMGCYMDAYLKGAYLREAEAKMLSADISRDINSGHQTIVCGDFNDFEGSVTLNRLTDGTGLRNAWSEKGCGLGFTYHGHGVMHFRLDHILYSPGIALKGIKVHDVELSDHDALVADFALHR